MPYQPIEDYGIIGDMHTAALVGMDGSIDWLCFPHFDSPSVFGAILDDRKGGRFRIAPTEGDQRLRQLYSPDTNVLVTRFLSPGAVGELTDFMPVGGQGRCHGRHDLVRRVQVVRGEMTFRLVCEPAFNYARDRHETNITPQGVVFKSGRHGIVLSSPVPLKRDRGGVVADFTLREGECAAFLLLELEDDAGPVPPLTESEATELLEHTIRFWRDWIGQCTYSGRWREIVHRSALALKLLTYEPTGAIVAAPTCSLPEHIGGPRNWDYRFTWLRDSAFTLYGLLRIGFTDEASRFMHWLEQRAREPNPDGSLQIMYSIDGRHELTEETLDHLEGYCGSGPVRIGNAAHNQLQLDIYGELMDSVYLYNKYGSPVSYDLWTHLHRLVDWIVEHWRQEDEGIWEVRGGRRHFVNSKLMSWVAVDRGLRLADKRSFPAPRSSWLKARDEIYQDIMQQGWSEERQAFVQSYGSRALDASNLLMPLVFFMAPSDPRMLKTLEAIMKSPAEGGLMSNSLVYRYNVEETDDGVSGDEGTFNICTFWLVEALARAGRDNPRKLEQARLIFERMLGYSNHLRLYGEETGTQGETLGNFPQALTHLSLISAAFNLDRALGPRYA